MARAHGDLHAQIQELSQRLVSEGAQAELYLKRGELHRFHGAFAEAAADLDRASELAPQLNAVTLARGQMLLAAGRSREAILSFDRFLEAEPGHPAALAARARAKLISGEYPAAAEDFTLALSTPGASKVEYYHERAKALKSAGPAFHELALTGLDEGIERLGNIPVLVLQAMEMEVLLGRFDAALTRIDGMLTAAVRPEFWLERRGDVLEQAGRSGLAKTSWQEALMVLRGRTPGLRQNAFSLQAEARLRQKLQRDITRPAQITR